jgi:hypothetical protein
MIYHTFWDITNQLGTTYYSITNRWALGLGGDLYGARLPVRLQGKQHKGIEKTNWRRPKVGIMEYIYILIYIYY